METPATGIGDLRDSRGVACATWRCEGSLVMVVVVAVGGANAAAQGRIALGLPLVPGSVVLSLHPPSSCLELAHTHARVQGGRSVASIASAATVLLETDAHGA